jgi:large subunit ribosomal protein L3
MPKHSAPRRGSMQFYPRVRAKKLLPRVRWNSLSKDDAGLLGFIGYKVGMKSAYVRDNNPTSLTKKQRIVIPVTIIECPTLKILAVRFYKNGKVLGDVLNNNLDKELKKKLKLPKQANKKIEEFEGKDFEDVRILAYSQVKKTGVKKTPDIAEIGLSGTPSEKLEFIKTNLPKEISIKDVFKEGLLDIRGVTIGKGTQGPTKRFGLALKTHKEEKGQRGPGSGGPWHPARVEYTQPMAGQMGFFNRVVYNNKILIVENIKENNINPSEGFKRYGNIKSDYIILAGSVQGPVKRQLLLTVASRPNKKQTQKNYEFIELR